MSLFAVALLISAQASASQPVANPAEQPAAAPVTVKAKKICKLDEGDSASRMTAKRVCKTADEWNQRPLGGSRSGFSISGEAMQSH